MFHKIPLKKKKYKILNGSANILEPAHAKYMCGKQCAFSFNSFHVLGTGGHRVCHHQVGKSCYKAIAAQQCFKLNANVSMATFSVTAKIC